MGQNAIKLELIEWLTKLNDIETLNFLKTVKESQIENQDWWFDLSQEEKEGIERGLKDVSLEKVTPHSEIVNKYGL